MSSDVAAWVAASVSVLALPLAFLAWRAQRNIRRLSYVLVRSAALLPRRVTDEVELVHKGEVVPDPAIAIVRIVNTGDEPIERDHFESPLRIQAYGPSVLTSVSCSARRPNDLRPDVRNIEGQEVGIAPLLLNPADAMEIQVISSGRVTDIELVGRVSDLKLDKRTALPYPPGSGREGEMQGFDKFMWFGLMPVVILAAGAGTAANYESTVTKVLIWLAAAVLSGVLYPALVSYLIRRRALWRPR